MFIKRYNRCLLLTITFLCIFPVLCKAHENIPGIETITAINDKLNNGTLTYKDIFTRDYGEYSEKNDTTKNALDALVKNVDAHISKNNKNDKKVVNINLDNIFEKNINKLVAIMLDKKNMKYGIYGSNGFRWFANDTNLKAPLNYFQQQVMLRVSSEILENIGYKIVKTIISSKKDYVIDFGILWPIYGNGCKLEKSFDLMKNYIFACSDKVEKEQNLSQHEVKVLKKILRMKNINQLTVSNVFERVAKMQILLKCNSWLSVADDVLKRDRERKLKAVKFN